MLMFLSIYIYILMFMYVFRLIYRPVCKLKCFSVQEKAESKASTPPSTAPMTGPGSVAKAAAAPGSVAKENGVKEPMPSTPFGGDGLNQPLSMNKQMTETSKIAHTGTDTYTHMHILNH